MDLKTDTFEQQLAFDCIPTVDPSRVGQWVNRGHISLVFGAPGTGRSRVWRFDEIVQLAAMEHLTRLGVGAKVAANAARRAKDIVWAAADPRLQHSVGDRVILLFDAPDGSGLHLTEADTGSPVFAVRSWEDAIGAPAVLTLNVDHLCRQILQRLRERRAIESTEPEEAAQ